MSLLDDLKVVATINNKNTDYTSYIYQSKRGNMIVFATTGSNSLQDWQHNLKTNDIVNNIKNTIGLSSEANNLDSRISPIKNSKIRVGQGFQKLYLNSRLEILNKLKNILQTFDHPHIVITGHSLGAALSMLLLLDISKESWFKKYISSINFIVFAIPRVGNDSFLKLFAVQTKDIKNKYFYVTESKSLTTKIIPGKSGKDFITQVDNGFSQVNLTVLPYFDGRFNRLEIHKIRFYIAAIGIDTAIKQVNTIYEQLDACGPSLCYCDIQAAILIRFEFS